MSSGLGEKCWHLLFVVGRMGLESKGAGVRDAWRTGEQEEEERRETELREGLGSDVERKSAQSNIRYSHLRAGITDYIRTGCLGTRNQLMYEHTIVSE